ncbi:Uncharacterised protein [Pseudomonas aeruginosa]|nr:Uncharacterised protein [Pseudomonas aeruginosa]
MGRRLAARLELEALRHLDMRRTTDDARRRGDCPAGARRRAAAPAGHPLPPRRRIGQGLLRQRFELPRRAPRAPRPARLAARPSAIAGSALNSSVWPRRAPRASSLLRLFAETGAASLSARRTRISPAKPLASCASACAGRACRPCGLARTARALGQSGGSSPPSAASTLRLLVARTSSAPRPSSNRSHRRSSSAWCASPRLARQNSPVTSCPWCCNGCAGVTKASPGRFTQLFAVQPAQPVAQAATVRSAGARRRSRSPRSRPSSTGGAPSQASSSRSSAFWPRPTSCASSASSCGAPCNRPRTSSALAACAQRRSQVGPRRGRG